MKLFFDKQDFSAARKLKDDRLRWLQELGADEIANAAVDDDGFLFGYHHGPTAHEEQIGRYENIHDRPAERAALIRLDVILRTLHEHQISVPTPRTWIIELDAELPPDLKFPLFVRTPVTSWKRGGEQSRVDNVRQLQEESELLRRAFGWNTPIIAREWLDIGVAGEWMYGPAPQEVRTWIVDGEPVAWSFHYLHAVANPAGFPPTDDELQLLARFAQDVARPFRSRLIAADFVRSTTGVWHFLEAGPGAVAGTAHEQVFKFVAQTVAGNSANCPANAVGGPL